MNIQEYTAIAPLVCHLDNSNLTDLSISEEITNGNDLILTVAP